MRDCTMKVVDMLLNARDDATRNAHVLDELSSLAKHEDAEALHEHSKRARSAANGQAQHRPPRQDDSDALLENQACTDAPQANGDNETCPRTKPGENGTHNADARETALRNSPPPTTDTARRAQDAKDSKTSPAHDRSSPQCSADGLKSKARPVGDTEQEKNHDQPVPEKSFPPTGARQSPDADPSTAEKTLANAWETNEKSDSAGRGLSYSSSGSRPSAQDSTSGWSGVHEPLSRQILSSLFAGLSNPQTRDAQHVFVENDQTSCFLYGLVAPLLGRVLAVSCPGLLCVVELPECFQGRGGAGSELGSRPDGRAKEDASAGPSIEPLLSAALSTQYQPCCIREDRPRDAIPASFREGVRRGRRSSSRKRRSRSTSPHLYEQTAAQSQALRLVCNGFEVLTGTVPSAAKDGSDNQCTLTTVSWDKAGIVRPAPGDKLVHITFSNGMISPTDGIVVSFSNGSVCQLTIRDPLEMLASSPMQPDIPTLIFLFSGPKGNQVAELVGNQSAREARVPDDTKTARRRHAITSANVFVVEVGHRRPHVNHVPNILDCRAGKAPNRPDCTTQPPEGSTRRCARESSSGGSPECERPKKLPSEIISRNSESPPESLETRATSPAMHDSAGGSSTALPSGTGSANLSNSLSGRMRAEERNPDGGSVEHGAPPEPQSRASRAGSGRGESKPSSSDGAPLPLNRRLSTETVPNSIPLFVNTATMQLRDKARHRSADDAEKVRGHDGGHIDGSHMYANGPFRQMSPMNLHESRRFGQSAAPRPSDATGKAYDQQNSTNPALRSASGADTPQVQIKARRIGEREGHGCDSESGAPSRLRERARYEDEHTGHSMRNSGQHVVGLDGKRASIPPRVVDAHRMEFVSAVPFASPGINHGYQMYGQPSIEGNVYAGGPRANASVASDPAGAVYPPMQAGHFVAGSHVSSPYAPVIVNHYPMPSGPHHVIYSYPHPYGARGHGAQREDVESYDLRGAPVTAVRSSTPEIKDSTRRDGFHDVRSNYADRGALGRGPEPGPSTHQKGHTGTMMSSDSAGALEALVSMRESNASFERNGRERHAVSSSPGALENGTRKAYRDESKDKMQLPGQGARSRYASAKQGLAREDSQVDEKPATPGSADSDASGNTTSGVAGVRENAATARRAHR